MQRLFLSSFSLLLGVLSLYAFTKISPKVDHSEITFPVMQELQGRVVSLDSVFFRYPYRLEVRGDRVVIEDLHGPDYYYHLFSYLDFRYLYSFGHRGVGLVVVLTVVDLFWNG